MNDREAHLAQVAQAEADIKEAQRRLDALLEVRARELYPDYDRFPEEHGDHDGGHGYTKSSCRADALRSIEALETAEETKNRWDRSKMAGRLVDMPYRLEREVKTIAFWEKRTVSQVISTAVAVYLAARRFEKPANPLDRDRIVT